MYLLEPFFVVLLKNYKTSMFDFFCNPSATFLSFTSQCQQASFYYPWSEVQCDWLNLSFCDRAVSNVDKP